MAKAKRLRRRTTTVKEETGASMRIAAEERITKRLIVLDVFERSLDKLLQHL